VQVPADDDQLTVQADRGQRAMGGAVPDQPSEVERAGDDADSECRRTGHDDEHESKLQERFHVGGSSVGSARQGLLSLSANLLIRAYKFESERSPFS